MPFYHNLNPTLLTIGSFEIRWYGLIFAVSFILAYFIMRFLVKERQIPLKEEDLVNFIFYEIIGIVIGARLFYILVYNAAYYLQNPLQILTVWHGGLSFHGGLIGAVVAGFIFSQKKNINLLVLADLAVIPAALGLFLGRIANFINGELVGTATNLPWGVKFRGYDGFRHPSQLYEAIKNLFIFFILLFLRNKKHKEGFLFAVFIILYSALRFAIGFFRAPDPQLGCILFNLTMGQLLNIIMLFTGVCFLYKLKR